MLEERGLATTVIGAVRPQMEKTRGPRGLFVPFMLGRPLGEPNDVPFQRRVLMQALNLLIRTDGPVILEDFPDDNPSWFDRADWQPAMALPTLPPAVGGTGWEEALRAELDLVLPAWDRFKTRFGRTTTGLAGQAPQHWPAFTQAFLRGELPTVPAHQTAALALRFLADDLKALYGEAVQADGPPPSARQIDNWFWSKTIAGQLLITLRQMAMESPNNALKTVGGRLFVPTPFVPKVS